MPTVTPPGLLAIALLGCVTAAVFGAQPLTQWVTDNVPAAQQAAEKLQTLAADSGLDQPYATLRRVARNAEAARFTPRD